MAIKNYITEDYLKGFIPELEKYLWPGETDYSKQKEKAEQVVINDFLNRGYKGLFLRPDSILREPGNIINESEVNDGSGEDEYSRMRLVYNVNVFTSNGNDVKTIILEGSDDSDSWETIIQQNITSTGLVSVLIPDIYPYYRISILVTGGTIDYKAYMAETVYDLFFAYQWLVLILLNASVQKDDQFDMKAKEFQKRYDALWDTAMLVTEDDNGIIKENYIGQPVLSRG